MTDIFHDLDQIESSFVFSNRNALAIYYRSALEGNPEAQLSLANLILDNCPSLRFEEFAKEMLKKSGDQGVKLPDHASNVFDESSESETSVTDSCQAINDHLFDDDYLDAFFKRGFDHLEVAYSSRDIETRIARTTQDTLHNILLLDKTRVYEQVFHNLDRCKAVLYANMIWEEKPRYFLKLVVAILIITAINSAMKQMVGVALGSIFISLLVYSIAEMFKQYYYCIVTVSELIIIPETDKENIVRFQVNDISSIRFTIPRNRIVIKFQSSSVSKDEADIGSGQIKFLLKKRLLSSAQRASQEFGQSIMKSDFRYKLNQRSR